MKKTFLLLALSLSTTMFGENVFNLRNTTGSDLEVKLRLGSESKTYALSADENKEITVSDFTCLNKAQALALTGSLSGQQVVMQDVKGCSGKTIIFATDNGKLKIIGIKTDTSPELGNKDPKKPTEETKKESDTTTETSDTTPNDSEELEEEEIKTYS